MRSSFCEIGSDNKLKRLASVQTISVGYHPYKVMKQLSLATPNHGELEDINTSPICGWEATFCEDGCGSDDCNINGVTSKNAAVGFLKIQG
jgi:hypothetical protein